MLLSNLTAMEVIYKYQIQHLNDLEHVDPLSEITRLATSFHQLKLFLNH